MRRRVLIIDDEEVNRELLQAYLLKNGYDVFLARNGVEAMDILRNEDEISAILLDLVMPIMDGYETLEEIRATEKTQSIPVIVQTVEKGSEKHALQLGANDYIIKPYDMEILMTRLDNTITLRENASVINAIQRDTLTGLYSRNYFLRLIEEMVAEKEAGYFVLSCFDIEKFKVVNDLYGTNHGDEVLKAVGKHFLEYFSTIDGICCRVNADNFAILYPSALVDSPEVNKVLEKAMSVSECLRNLTFSVGRYIVEDKTLSANAMYDRAMIAKATVKGRYDEHIGTFDESMRKRILGEQEIVSSMKTALEKKQFVPWFQPQYNHETGAIIGAEVLVRWLHPDKGLIPPGMFIPIFEQNGSVYELDKYVWEESCIFLRRLISERRNIVPLSVNISRYDILQEDLCDVIFNMVKKYDLPTELLRLEITESAFAKSSARVIAVVKHLKENGFMVEIDDFGSGYSSLNTLKDVPADVLKLDMKFLEGDNNVDRGGNIIASVVRMAKWIGMSVIAEGVETIQQANFLRSIGCCYIQGYLYSKPVPMEEYEMVLERSIKEETMLAMEKVETYDMSAFWNPSSMDTLIFNSFVGGACIFEYSNERTTMLRINNKLAKMFAGGKLTASEILEINYLKYLSEHDYKRVLIAIKRAIVTMEEVSEDISFRDFWGTERYTYVRAIIKIIAKSGDRSLFYCLMDNITEQKYAEQLRYAAERKEMESAQQLQVIMSNINGGVSALEVKQDGTSRMVFNNEKYFELYGYSRSRALSENLDVMSLILPEDLPDVLGKIDELKRTRIPTVIDYRAKKLSGEIIYMRANCSLMSMEGYPEGVITSVVTDITEQRLLNDQLHALIDNINGGVIASTMRDNKVDVQLVNNHFYEILGYTKAQYMRECEDSFSRVHPEDRERVINDLKTQSKEQNSFTLEYRIVRRDGAIRWIKNTVSVIRVFGFNEDIQLAVAYDVTEQREITEQLELLNSTAQCIMMRMNPDQSLIISLEKLRKYFDGDRGYIVELNYDEMKTGEVYESCQEGLDEVMGVLKGVPFDETQFWYKLLSNSTTFHVQTISDIPIEQIDIRSLLEQYGISSIITSAITRDGKMIGFVGINNPKQAVMNFERLSAMGDYIAILLTHRDYYLRHMVAMHNKID